MKKTIHAPHDIETAVSRLTTNFPTRHIEAETKHRVTRLKGTLMQAKGSEDMHIKNVLECDSNIEKVRKKLQEYEKLAKAFADGKYEGVLSGDSVLSLPHEHSFFHNRILRKTFPHVKRDASSLGPFDAMHATYDTGFDHRKKQDLDFYKYRYKFYFSLHLDTSEKEQRANEMFGELFAYARAHKIYITTKTLDHNYDSFNIYTTEVHEIKNQIEKLYKRYVRYDFFAKVPHFFQGPLNGVDPDHIGFVQEPHAMINSDSHSFRMRMLGRGMDAGREYEDICREIGINPRAPWLLTEGFFEKKNIQQKIMAHRDRFAESDTVHA